MTLIQAQQRYVNRVNDPNNNPGHLRRVRRGASNQFYKWARGRGIPETEISILLNDAIDMAKLERDAEE